MQETSKPESAATTAQLLINGEEHTVAFPTHHTLLEVIREECGLTGTKHGCELGECGACAVLVDGKPVLSCLALAAEFEERELETVEGMQNGNELHPLQATFADLGATQCGYCIPGILLAAKSLLDENSKPSEQEICEALAGNLCRCTGYHKIIEAIQWAGRILQGDSSSPPESVFIGENLPNADAT